MIYYTPRKERKLMKQKNIILTTIALIVAMTLSLSLGLTMLHATATGNDPISNESFFPEKPDLPEKEQPNMHEDLDEGLRDNNTVTPEGNQENNSSTSEKKDNKDQYSRCIVIDIYKHSNGEYVGQVIIDSEESYSTLSDLFYDYATNRKETFIPNVETSNKEHWLPESKYRIEVMAGSIFAYSYGVENNTMMETLQCGLTFFGGEKVIEFIDSFIKEEIAKIESGNYVSPNEKNSIAEIEKLTQYWYGGYHEILGTYLPENGRLTPRFPYLITE